MVDGAHDLMAVSLASSSLKTHYSCFSVWSTGVIKTFYWFKYTVADIWVVSMNFNAGFQSEKTVQDLLMLDDHTWFEIDTVTRGSFATNPWKYRLSITLLYMHVWCEMFQYHYWYRVYETRQCRASIHWYWGGLFSLWYSKIKQNFDWIWCHIIKKICLTNLQRLNLVQTKKNSLQGLLLTYVIFYICSNSVNMLIFYSQLIFCVS